MSVQSTAGEPPLPGSAGPLDIAMDEARAGAAVSSPARVLLEKQSLLIDEQIVLARDDRRYRGWQIASERAGFALKVLTGVAGVAVAGVLAAMAWTAAHDETVVFDAFAVPPELAARGLTGQVVATRFLDRVRAIHANSDDSRPAQTFRGDWSGQATVQIPGAGISLGDLTGFLRQQLGQETHVGGEVVRTPPGYQVTVRGEGVPAQTVSSGPEELDQALNQAAEAFYRQAQPYRYGAYLLSSNRRAEAEPVLRSLAQTGPRSERPWAWAALAYLYSLDGDQRRSLAAARSATRLDPAFVLGHQYTAITASFIGLSETELAGHRAAARLGPSEGMTADAARIRRVLALTNVSRLTGDFASALATSAPRSEGPTGAGLAAILNVGLHDLAASRQMAARTGDASDVARLRHALDGIVLPVDFEIAAEAQRWPEALASIQATEAALPSEAFWTAVRDVYLRPRLAVALAHNGDFAGAQAAIAPTAADCYPCLRARGRVALLAGQIDLAERWFTEAIRQAPSIPFAYLDAGQARRARGDVEGAIALFRQAQQRGPRWADPLKYEADALVRQRDFGGALSRYAAAAERASRWGALYLAWGQALAASGRPDDALAKWRAAASMDLSAADRAALNTLLATRPR